MALNLTGISNENEFYTHHYLSAILESDLKEVFEKWRLREQEEELKPPYTELRGLAREYLGIRNRLERVRRPADRLELQRDFFQQLLPILGYEFSPALQELDDGSQLPVIGAVNRPNGAPELWIIEALELSGEGVDPLLLSLDACQYADNTAAPGDMEESLEVLITRKVFGRSEPPRWVLLVSDTQVVLLDRGKWNEKRLLRFDLTEIFSRREHSTFQAMAALLHRDSVCPAEGLCLLDTLDENSHKHAYAVSEDLKYALREAIELIGNEAVGYLREIRRKGIFSGEEKIDSAQLTLECLRYMYRLLFLFYIEARPELGYAPMKAEAYRQGYSLETLRDLELVKLTTAESKEGYFIHESLQLLFAGIYNGFNWTEEYRQKVVNFEDQPEHYVFRTPPLKSHLFDPARTPILERVKFRNSILQRVIELMSLSRPKGRKDRRGRISYAQLGINQLGAVYEALLSYRGFFAETDLYEVKKKDEGYDELNTAYFVKAEDLAKYEEEERVYNGNGSLKKYLKGTFIYRLAGRDREKSASYYTPESLTRCLVKYALKELLKDKSADDILTLTICEPAMGSAAFLNEAVNQLAEAYLERKQKELGQSISHEDYAHEKQKVKMYLADRNVFGVDLNPVAVELAEVSLWLNTIHAGAYVPWFGMQLACGNSLIGARRQVFAARLLRRGDKQDPLWLDEVPQRIMPGEQRPKNAVYHFLLPDRGMADYKDKVVRELAPVEMKQIKEWRKAFTTPFSKEEIPHLTALSAAVDRLWETHTRQQRRIRERTQDLLTVFGQPEPQNKKEPTTTEFKDKVYEQELLSKNVRASSPYRRLKLAMDYWCALWFWPIEKADLLPSRPEFLLELSLILQGDVLETTSGKREQLALFPSTMPKQQALDLVDRLGLVDVDNLISKLPRLALVQKLSERYRFHHWELEFADLFADRGGFDLTLGNPPWIKVQWNEGGILGDVEPLYVLRNYSSPQLTSLRTETISAHGLYSSYLAAFEEAEATLNFLNALQNYPYLKGMQTNLYKCFLPQAWMFSNENGGSGFLHPEGVYDDPNGGKLRHNIYNRLCYHFQFQNGLNLFAEVAHREKYSINIYSNKYSNSFVHISNLFHPSTVDQCFMSNSIGICGGIKDDNNNWNLIGHSDRVILIDIDTLAMFAKLYDDENTPATQARLPVVHSRQLIYVLNKISNIPHRLLEFDDKYLSTVFWDETGAQTDGTIKRNTLFPENLEELILSGPHFYVANPLYKTPRKICNEKSHYDVIDLTFIPDDYVPRTNYFPSCKPTEYRRRIPRVIWDRNKLSIEYYRVVTSRRLSQAGERTLQVAIIPPFVSHINTVFSLSFYDTTLIPIIAATWSSLPFDFYIKTNGKNDFRNDSARVLPILKNIFDLQLNVRTLMLNCLTTHYNNLWTEVWDELFQKDIWTRNDPRLNNARYTDLTKEWNRNCALRSDYERRQALVEIDVLVAMALGLTKEDMKSIYRIQFPVLRQNEQETFYDQNGRIVFTVSKGLPGVGFSRPEWDDLKTMKSGTVERKIIDDTLPGGPRERTIVYQAPFDRCDRERDYETAWAEFSRRLGLPQGG